MDKPTTSTVKDTATKQVYLENATPVSKDTNKIYMNQLGLFVKRSKVRPRLLTRHQALFKSLNKLLT
ncbi:13026_t:CDS:1, partial [Funneliformis caledonium]